MSTGLFEKILRNFLPWKSSLKYTSLCGLGETLLDKDVAAKVRIAKELRFPSVAIYTNASHLSESLSMSLLESGLDALCISVDGIRKETHESIRRNLNYDQVLSNILKFLELRNQYGKTRVIVKMVRQQRNRDEWREYQEFWGRVLSASHGDLYGYLDIHNYSANVSNAVVEESGAGLSKLERVCDIVFEVVFVRSNGSVGLCCGDVLDRFDLGDASEESIGAIFNNDIIVKYREKMLEGKMGELDYCKDCSTIMSQRNYFSPSK